MEQIIIANTDEIDNITHEQKNKSTLIIITGKHSDEHYMIIKNRWGKQGIMLRAEIEKILLEKYLH